MTVAWKLCAVILLWLAAAQADVSHLAYRRHKGERLRLQRLESEPTPYPAAGYRPNREFGLPQQQPLFPFGNQHGSRPSGSTGFNSLGEAQRPQLTYDAAQQEPRYRPQNFNNADEPQEQVFVVRYHQRQPAQAGFNNLERPQPTQNTNGFNDFADDQPYHYYDSEEQTTISNQQPQNDFNNFAKPQEPDAQYGAPNSQEPVAQSARLRQQLIARLQRVEQQEQLQKQQLQQAESQRYRKIQSQQFVNAPQTQFHSVLSEKLQLQAESKTSRLVAPKPARLTDNREEIEIESDAKTAETEEIETTTKAVGNRKLVPQVGGAAAAADSVNTPVVPNPGVVGYYPASAVGFVQPLNTAAYIASANYQTAQPFPAAYTLGAPYLPQQYIVAANPAAPFKAW